MLDINSSGQPTNPAWQEEESSTPAPPAEPQTGTPQRAPVSVMGDAEVVQHINVQTGAYVDQIVGKVVHQHYTTPSPATRERMLRALLHDHSGFIASRLEAFVGREAELAEVRQRIAEKLPSGGYITITGHAGQGKSSVIAKLVAEQFTIGRTTTTALRERLLESGTGVPICHFIPFSPGPDHQVGLLRNLIARLCLIYDLPEFYAASDSRPALRDYFGVALREAAQHGRKVVIYIDGIDQIEEDASGARDLSFLPVEPPAGVVFVLGTRPNDTLRPLEIRAPRHEYWLPTLSRADFDRILQHRGVALSPAVADRFYAAMQENALYLDLAAKELRERGHLPPEELIQRIADNPDNLFSLGIERLQRNERQWELVLRPVLGLLLVARAPLSARALRALIGVEDLRLQKGLERLGGLIQRDGEGRYSLFHLKLGEFLRQDAARPGKAYIFAIDEEQGFNHQLVDWCEGGNGAIWADVPGDSLEQERRAYGRNHYIAQLAVARDYERLWFIIDAGEHGRASRRHDPSMRGAVRDLNTARQAVTDQANGDTDALARGLPRLWRYSLLRCALASQVDTYPEHLLLAMVALGRSNEAVNLAELQSDPLTKIDRLRALGRALLARDAPEGLVLLQRAGTIAAELGEGEGRIRSLCGVAATLVQAQQRDAAEALLDDASSGLEAIREPMGRMMALGMLASGWAFAGNMVAAERLFNDAAAAASAIPDSGQRAYVQSSLAERLISAAQFERAEALARSLPDDIQRIALLGVLVEALVRAGRLEAAYTAVGSLPPSWQRSSLLCVIAETLIRVGQLDRAEQIIAIVPKDRERTRILSILIDKLTLVGEHERARAICTRLPDSTEGFTISYLFAQSLARAGQTETAEAQIAAARVSAKRLMTPTQHPNAVLHNLELLVATGQFDRAYALATSIADPWGRTRALATIAEALNRAGDFAFAHTVIDAIPDLGEQVGSRLGLGIALAWAGQVSEAASIVVAVFQAIMQTERANESLLRDLVDPLAYSRRLFNTPWTATERPENQEHAAVLVAMVLAIAQHGHFAAAAAVYAAALRAARTIFPFRLSGVGLEPRYDPDDALADLVAALVYHGEWDIARQAADVIVSTSKRSSALGILTTYLATDGRINEAEVILAAARPRPTVGVKEKMDHDQFLRKLAVAFGRAGEHERARAILEAFTLESERAQVRFELAEAYIEVGDVANAGAMLLALHQSLLEASSGIDQAQMFTSVAEALARVGQAEQARQIAGAIPVAQERAKALWTLAEVLHNHGESAAVADDFAAAREAADAIDTAQLRVEALAQLAAALARSGRAEEAGATLVAARHVADSISHGYFLDRALWQLAGALAETGEPDAARALATTLADDYQRARALADVGERMARAGLSSASQDVFTLAFVAADKVANSNGRSEALANLGIALAQQQLWQRVEQVVWAIPNAWHQGQVLLAVVKSLAADGQWRDARLALERIVTSSWRAHAVTLLGGALARAGRTREALELVHAAWLQATTRDDLVDAFVIDAALIRAYPELGEEFLDSFAWVDAQLGAS